MKGTSIQNIATLLMPEEALAPLLVVAGLLMIVGLRKAASGIIAFVLITAFMPVFEPLIEALFDALPDWAMLVFLFIVGLSLLRAFLTPLLGKYGAEHVVSQWVANFIQFLILLPFRSVFVLVRWLFAR